MQENIENKVSKESTEITENTENTENKQYFGTELLKWYERSKRDLPWRRHRDPYYIWVSEIMLQQTRVDTVIPYFQRFIERFPTLKDLAEAPEEDVLKCWEGLGYYSRARNLQAAARQVVERHGGTVPSVKAEVAALKGVGPYTTGAILSIAFNQPEPAVDGNVMRVLSRYFLIREDIMKTGTRTRMEELAASLIPRGRAADFNQALMELGALICTPKSPSCLVCPVMARCAARLEGAEDALPVKSKAKPPRPEYRLVALVEGDGEHAGRVLVRRRPASGLLARMWELPHIPAAADAGEGAGLPDGPAMDRLAAALAAAGFPAQPAGFVMNAEHTFSHIHWNLRVYRFSAAADSAFPAAYTPSPASYGGATDMAFVAEAGAAMEEGVLPLSMVSASPDSSRGELEEYRWISKADMEGLAFPNVFLRILSGVFN
ncbi:A/G-specific adenine glycosylase [Paenibacillus faecis]|uniref:Adenine DNA glycosylase n=1 Tax=Paenibacillus faecis TaxID=862114 RepID=A0A5D0CQS9_9BACL|nr:A/G-specific adenine glycosylase [Paenibacillus faecis]TYA11674.1 A/G-specific adenine glycosylase [Paenibacillus faecis]